MARVATAAILAVSLSGCVQNFHRTQETLVVKPDRQTAILVLPVDAELSELSFGGFPTPRQDWTLAARENMNASLRAEFGEKSVTPHFHEGEIDDETTAKLMRLHAAVGRSIMLHQYDGLTKLPTKVGEFDWTLGPSAAELGRRRPADYALFIHVRDSYSGPGRIAAQFVVAAVFGLAIQGGVQTGFASLVELETGRVVWFNRLQRGAGDLRTAEPAKETIKALLAGMPG
jgi:hypothetical protein